MQTKLTLTIEKEVIMKAKQYAKQTGRSVSDMVENYLKQITSKDTIHNQLSPKLKRIVGAVKLPKHFDEHAIVRTYYEKKHL